MIKLDGVEAESLLLAEMVPKIIRQCVIERRLHAIAKLDDRKRDRLMREIIPCKPVMA
jgi:hypothetical protein